MAKNENPNVSRNNNNSSLVVLGNDGSFDMYMGFLTGISIWIIVSSDKIIAIFTSLGVT